MKSQEESGGVEPNARRIRESPGQIQRWDTKLAKNQGISMIKRENRRNFRGFFAFRNRLSPKVSLEARRF
jgi:hypothetical protein